MLVLPDREMSMLADWSPVVQPKQSVGSLYHEPGSTKVNVFLEQIRPRHATELISSKAVCLFFFQKKT